MLIAGLPADSIYRRVTAAEREQQPPAGPVLEGDAARDFIRTA